ncbi:unnamed protein product [Diplocarpon coronariae]
MYRVGRLDSSRHSEPFVGLRVAASLGRRRDDDTRCCCVHVSSRLSHHARLFYVWRSDQAPRIAAAASLRQTPVVTNGPSAEARLAGGISSPCLSSQAHPLSLSLSADGDGDGEGEGEDTKDVDEHSVALCKPQRVLGKIPLLELRLRAAPQRPVSCRDAVVLHFSVVRGRDDDLISYEGYRETRVPPPPRRRRRAAVRPPVSRDLSILPGRTRACGGGV